MSLTLCDSNVWFALALSTHEHNATAARWLDTVGEPASVLFCRATQQSFLRLLTIGSPLAEYGVPPLTNDEAWATYEALIADERIILRSDEPSGLERRWRNYALRPTASPKLWMDAYLAAFALAGGYRMVTFDAAFRQFDGLDLLLLGESGSSR